MPSFPSLNEGGVRYTFYLIVIIISNILAVREYFCYCNFLLRLITWVHAGKPCGTNLSPVIKWQKPSNISRYRFIMLRAPLPIMPRSSTPNLHRYSRSFLPQDSASSLKDGFDLGLWLSAWSLGANQYSISRPAATEISSGEIVIRNKRKEKLVLKPFFIYYSHFCANVSADWESSLASVGCAFRGGFSHTAIWNKTIVQTYVPNHFHMWSHACWQELWHLRDFCYKLGQRFGWQRAVNTFPVMYRCKNLRAPCMRVIQKVNSQIE